MQAQMIKTAEVLLLTRRTSQFTHQLISFRKGQAVITSVQSLAAIRALIQTSFGCIAYLR
jgi:hypothetical protein